MMSPIEIARASQPAHDRRNGVRTTKLPQYWIEARTSIKTPDRVMSYGVWHINDVGARERVGNFATARKGGWVIALHLANKLRDDFNAEIE
jgi:hypothetical protein